MRKDVVFSSNGQPMYAFRTGGAAMLSFKSGDAPAHQASKPAKSEEEGADKGWIPWGAADDFPIQVAKLIRKSTVGRAGLQLLTKSIYGQRTITYKIVDVTASGKEVMELVKVPEWEELKNRSNFDMVRLALAQDYAWFGVCMPQLRFNAGKNDLWSIDHHKMSHCRFSPADPKTGIVKEVFISGNFPDAELRDCQRLPVIDGVRYMEQLELIKEDSKTLKYVMPLMWPDVLNDYYPVAYWDSSRESGQLDIATSIPAYKKSLFKNQMSLKYDIQVPVEYFEQRYKDWAQMGEDARSQVIGDLLDDITDKLTGADNAQKAIMSFYRSDKLTGKASGKWEFNVIDDKMRNDAYLPDAAASNSEILFSMLINPATIGQGNTGGNYSGGANNGGSNIRESGLQLRSLLQADRDILNGVFNFYKQFRGLDPEVKLGTQDMVLTTLDQGHGTEKVVS